jgi:hypothetical protein
MSLAIDNDLFSVKGDLLVCSIPLQFALSSIIPIASCSHIIGERFTHNALEGRHPALLQLQDGEKTVNEMFVVLLPSMIGKENVEVDGCRAVRLMGKMRQMLILMLRG